MARGLQMKKILINSCINLFSSLAISLLKLKVDEDWFYVYA